ncbi:CLUMA_CG018760, isoform A [Clunio marinus]|uniref:CLUMA_CG018760, isoform A n=1 Tax=Clunio marinus TaxID=568069 RepID=A0A1J1IZP1_9DIPT|nr:CLUMA_CG018760, isoform A [Clunio marinus]
MSNDGSHVLKFLADSFSRSRMKLKASPLKIRWRHGRLFFILAPPVNQGEFNCSDCAVSMQFIVLSGNDFGLPVHCKWIMLLWSADGREFYRDNGTAFYDETFYGVLGDHVCDAPQSSWVQRSLLMACIDLGEVRKKRFFDFILLTLTRGEEFHCEGQYDNELCDPLNLLFLHCNSHVRGDELMNQPINKASKTARLTLIYGVECTYEQ